MAAIWTAPQYPDPPSILHSAVDDKRDGRYEQSLAKFVWFHYNAVRYERGQSAVRRSFALAYWLDLATVYPPARDAFIRTRDETELAFRQNLCEFDMFHDVASMNHWLGDGIRTADLFATVAATDQDKAQVLYQIAEPSLIAAGRFRECAPFLEPKRRMESAARCYQISKQHEESRRDLDPPVPKLARTHYIRNVATLVGLLVLNDGVDDARAAYSEALSIIDDGEFRQIMDAAMSGHLPEARLR
jgi:hypothetical protein